MTSQPPVPPSDAQGQSPDRPQPPTNMDGLGQRIWLVDDPVNQLRDWTSDEVHKLPEDATDDYIVGRDPSAWLRLADAEGLISRRHARLRCPGKFWYLEDMNSKNGTHVDGERCTVVMLLPGQEIGIGEVTLVAESERLIQLRGYLARILGWSVASWELNLAIRAIRAAGNRRAPLVIAGVNDPTSVARQIHCRTTSPDAPFVVCDSKLRRTDTSLGIQSFHSDVRTAVEMAEGGTVCVRAQNLPSDFNWLVKTSKERRGPVQLYICVNTAPETQSESAPPITIPDLAQRPPHEIERVVLEYAADAIAALRAGPGSFTKQNHEWAAVHAASSLAEVEIMARRIVAYNDSKQNMKRAADRAGLSRPGLGKWLERQGLK